MAATSKSRIVYLDTLVDLNQISKIDSWPLKGLRPWPSENVTAIYDDLKSLSVDQPWNVYLRDLDMPPRWHFSATYRIAPIYVVPDPGWIIVNSREEFDVDGDEDYSPKGAHGYDNDNELMRSLFLGRGPGLQYSYPVKPFENIEVYGIMTNILGIKPNPNNGTFPRGRMLPLPQSASVTTPSATTTTTATPEVDVNGIPELTPADWEEIEADVEAAEDEDGPLTWKEYLELKAEEMKEEIDMWWDWIKHAGEKGDEHN
jgi:hypothetical protein